MMHHAMSASRSKPFCTFIFMPCTAFPCVIQKCVAPTNTDATTTLQQHKRTATITMANERTNERTNGGGGGGDERTDKRTNGRTDGWTDGRTDERKNDDSDGDGDDDNEQ